MKAVTEHEVLGQTVRLTVDITGAGTVSDQAMERIHLVLAREGERLAQIAGVDVRDQGLAAVEAERLRSLPPASERPHTVLIAGIKGAEGRIVVREGTR